MPTLILFGIQIDTFHLNVKAEDFYREGYFASGINILCLEIAIQLYLISVCV